MLFRSLKSIAEGEIRIGASDSLIKHLLLPKLNAFHARHPGVRIRLSHGRTPDIAARLKDGKVDLALVHLPLDDPMLDVRELTVQEGCFVAGERFFDLASRPLEARELASMPLILLSPGSSTRTFVERWFAAKGLSAAPDIELGSVDLLIEFAKQGYGVAYVARAFVEAELASGRLAELKPAETLPPQRIGVAVRRGMRLSLAAERFAATLTP